MLQQISLLIPYQTDHGHRDELLEWLTAYWLNELPEAEVVIGTDYEGDGRVPFSKTQAVNEAFSRCTGDVIVIVDADGYLPGEVIRHAARRIRKARQCGARLWFVPYLEMYRLNEPATADVLNTSSIHPHRFTSPPPQEDVEDHVSSSWGRRFGALIQIMPREAFETVGGMDPRFRGWGGEDVSFLRAVDTLWGHHKNVPGDVLHLWHPKINTGVSDQWHSRVWPGQKKSRANDWLSTQYNKATNKPEQMRKLVDDGFKKASRWQRFWHWIWVHLHRKKKHHRHCS